MAFNKINFAKISSSLNNDVPRMWSYLTTTDTLEDVKVDGYFNDIISEVTLNDLLYVNASDGAELYRLGPLVGSDIALSFGAPNYINLHKEFTTTVAVPESFNFIVPHDGFIISASLAPPNGTGAGESFSFDLVVTTATVTTINIAQLTPAGFTTTQTLSTPFAVTKNDAIKWEKGSGATSGIDFQGAVVLSLT